MTNNNIVEYDYKYPKIRLGLCCMNITLKYSENVYCSRKKILSTILKEGLEPAKKIAIDNIIDLAKMVIWSKNHGISVMRISSELLVHCTNPEIIKKFGKAGEDYKNFEFLRPYLEKVGGLAKAYDMRCTSHPGQYVQLGSLKEHVVKNSIKELAMHVRFFEMMKLNKDSVMVIHVGGTSGNKISAGERFMQTFRNLPDDIKKYIVLENDEKSFDAQDVLFICNELKVPMVFDIFHYICYKKYHKDQTQMSIDEMMPGILATWKYRNQRPKFHLSEQAPKKPVGSHSLFVNTIPKEFLEIPTKYNIEVDIMIEAKGKEIAIGRLYKKYPQLKPEFAEYIQTELPEKAIKDLGISEDVLNGCKYEC